MNSSYAVQESDQLCQLHGVAITKRFQQRSPIADRIPPTLILRSICILEAMNNVSDKKINGKANTSEPSCSIYIVDVHRTFAFTHTNWLNFKRSNLLFLTSDYTQLIYASPIAVFIVVGNDSSYLLISLLFHFQSSAQLSATAIPTQLLYITYTFYLIAIFKVKLFQIIETKQLLMMKTKCTNVNNLLYSSNK